MRGGNGAEPAGDRVFRRYGSGFGSPCLVGARAWMEAVGILDDRHDEVDDIVQARNVPSPIQRIC